MYRTDLCVLIKQAINNSPPENWPGGLVLGTDAPSVNDVHYVPVEVALDPYQEGGVYKPGVFIVPGTKEYSTDTDRKKVTKKRHLHYVTICLAVKLQGQPTDNDFDVTNVADWSKWMKLKDDLDEFLRYYDWSQHSLSIEAFEPEPPDEISLDNKYYLETTVIGYAGC